MTPEIDRRTSGQPSERRCPACGQKYPAGTRFCPSDGQPLREDESSTDWLVGKLVADRYHVERKLGVGGMGVVYLAQHVYMSRPCALKVLRPEFLSSGDALGRFARGAQNASRIAHPNVAAVYDFGEVAGESMYLAMEYVDGVSLGDVLESNGHLSVARTATIVAQVASALKAAHELGIVHRDLKPDNIMLARSGEADDMVKVVDFGIARAVVEDAQRVTESNAMIGTPAYMSPEQINGGDVDARSDLYSLALVTVVMLTGTLPHSADRVDLALRFLQRPKRLRELRPETEWPAALQSVMDQALAASPDDRQENVAQFARELMDALRDWRPAEVATSVANLSQLGADVSLALPPEAFVRIATPHVSQAAIAPVGLRTKGRRPAILSASAIVLLLALLLVSTNWSRRGMSAAPGASARTTLSRTDSAPEGRLPESPRAAPPSAPPRPASGLAAKSKGPNVRTVESPPRQSAALSDSARGAPLAADTARHDSLSLTTSSPARPSTGSVIIGAPRMIGAFLFLNDQPQGSLTSLRAISLPPGPVRISLRLDPCQNWDSTVVVVAGRIDTIGTRQPACKR